MLVNDRLEVGGAQVAEFLIVERLEHLIGVFIGFYAGGPDLTEMLGLPISIDLSKGHIVALVQRAPCKPL